MLQSRQTQLCLEKPVRADVEGARAEEEEVDEEDDEEAKEDLKSWIAELDVDEDDE